MCYSAQVWADYRAFTRLWGATLSIKEFVRLYVDRAQGARIRTPKAMDAAFLDAGGDGTSEIASLIREYDAAEAMKVEQDLFKQKKRLSDAERTLQTKQTKAALESQRIATQKIEWSLGKLGDLRRTELKGKDSRMFPGWYVPVMIVEDGKRVVKPMRYQCRTKPNPDYDLKYPGTYNARRDNLEKFWKDQFGAQHGIMVVNAFFENVSRHKAEHRELGEGEKEENVVLEFRPRPAQDMIIACLWTHWMTKEGEDLWSFAAITDEPPPEVADAGHDRCIIQIKAENVDAWLNPSKSDLATQQAILDDRALPFYEHRMAA